MNLNRQILEEYLDGELPATDQAQIQNALTQDPAAAELVRKLQTERALRANVFSSYEPTEVETQLTARAWMAEFRQAPVGFISRQTWGKQLARLAAAIVIAAGAFAAGQYSVSWHSTAAPSSTASASARTWVVEYPQANGQTATREFTSYEEAQKFAQDVTQSNTQVADAGGVF